MSNLNSDEQLYDFAPQTPAPRTVLKAVPVADPAAPIALAYRAPNEDKPKPAEAEKIKHVYLPLGLLGSGIVIELFVAIIWSHSTTAALAEMIVDLTLGTGVMLVAMLIAAKIRHIDLGSLGIAAYKLAAISIAPVALAEFMSPITRYIPMGGIIALIVEFILFFSLLGALFDLDESDTWYCVCVMFVTRVGLYFVLQLVFHS